MEYVITSIQRFGPKMGQYGEFYTWNLELEGVEGKVVLFDNKGNVLTGIGVGDKILDHELIENGEFNGVKQWKLKSTKPSARQYNNSAAVDLTPILDEIDLIKKGMKVLNQNVKKLMEADTLIDFEDTDKYDAPLPDGEFE